MVEPFQVLLCDCPWKYGNRKNPGTKFGLGANYARKMTIDDLCAMGPLIQAVTAPQTVMYFWVTGPMDHAKAAHRVIDAWGFRVSTWGLVWIKYAKKRTPLVLPGNKTGSNAELAFLCWKGKPLTHAEKLVPQVLQTYRRLPHSRKPDEQYERIERAFPQEPRLELFATQRRPGWTALGFELTSTDIRDDLRQLADDPDDFADPGHRGGRRAGIDQKASEDPQGRGATQKGTS